MRAARIGPARGRAGQAPATSTLRRATRRRVILHRAVAVVLAVLVVTLTAPWGAPAARAADPIATNKQVGVIVTKIAPRSISPQSTVTVAGTLVNHSAHPLTSVDLRLQAGGVLTSRFALHVADNEPPAAENGWCSFSTVTDSLAPGQTVHFSSACPASQLGLSATGVYPLKVNINAVQFDGTAARVGEANTFLPYFPTTPQARTRIAWLWPVTDRPHQLADGTFLDDDLAGSLAPSGHLYRLLQVPAETPQVPITFAIDPRLVSEVQAMTHTYHVHSGGGMVAGHGQEVATAWLQRLRELIARPNVRVIALPYGDPDLVTMAKAGLGNRISFAFDRGATVLSDVLGVKHPLPMVWPPEGALNDQTLYALAGNAFQGLVLSSDALPGGPSKFTPDSVTSVQTQGGSKVALTSDRAVDNLVKRTDFPTGPRVGEQRFMAEIAMITAERPDVSRSVVIMPPRQWTVPEEYARSILADTQTPWSVSTSLQHLLHAPRGPARGPLTYPGPQPSPTLSLGQQQRLVSANASLDDFRDILSNSDANKVLTPYYEALLASASSGFRTEPRIGAAYADDLLRRTAALRDKVRIVVPVNGTYSLASSSSPLVLTLTNALSVPVTVEVSATARGSAGFHAQPAVRTIAPQSRATVHLPATVQRSGVFPVTAKLTTRSGSPLGQPVTLRVRSTAYGGITLGITGGALALLVILVAIRLTRRIRSSGDNGPADPEAVPDEPEPTPAAAEADAGPRMEP